MRCSLFEEGEDERHMFDVEMDAPNVGDTIWTNALGYQAHFLPEHLRGHKRLLVVRRSFSVIVSDKYNTSSYCEVLVRVEGRDA